MNQATVSANEVDPNLDNNTSLLVSTAVVRTADLVITKTAPASVQHGDPIPYTLTVTNLGPDIACGVTVSDSFRPTSALRLFLQGPAVLWQGKW